MLRFVVFLAALPFALATLIYLAVIVLALLGSSGR